MSFSPHIDDGLLVDCPGPLDDKRLRNIGCKVGDIHHILLQLNVVFKRVSVLPDGGQASGGGDSVDLACPHHVAGAIGGREGRTRGFVVIFIVVVETWFYF